MMETPTAPAAMVQLSVLTGVHSGAQCGLPDGESSIGSGMADNVVLSDAGILPNHLTIEMQGASATLRAAHDGVAVNGVVLAPGAPFSAVPPFELAFADVVLRCGAEPDAAGKTDKPPASGARFLLMAGLRFVLKSPWCLPVLVCAAVAVLIIPPAMSSIVSGAGASSAGRVGRPDTEPMPSGNPAAPSEVPPDPAAAPAMPVAPPPDAKAAPSPDPAPSLLAEAVQELQAELAARSLAGIEVAAADGAILAHGQLEPQDEAGWRLVQQQFDADYGRRATLVDEVRFTAAPALKVSVDAVWTGPNPNVVIKGQKFFEGATLPNGLLIERIMPGELLVAHDGQRQTFKF